MSRRNSQGVAREIEKEQKNYDDLAQKFGEIKRKMSVSMKLLSTLTAEYEGLRDSEMQVKIAKIWFEKGKRRSDEEILKYLEISEKLEGKINILEVDEVVEAVLRVHADKTENARAFESEMETSQSDENLEIGIDKSEVLEESNTLTSEIFESNNANVNTENTEITENINIQTDESTATGGAFSATRNESEDLQNENF